MLLHQIQHTSLNQVNNKSTISELNSVDFLSSDVCPDFLSCLCLHARVHAGTTAALMEDTAPRMMMLVTACLASRDNGMTCIMIVNLHATYQPPRVILKVHVSAATAPKWPKTELF